MTHGSLNLGAEADDFHAQARTEGILLGSANGLHAHAQTIDTASRERCRHLEIRHFFILPVIAASEKYA